MTLSKAVVKTKKNSTKLCNFYLCIIRYVQYDYKVADVAVCFTI